MILGKSQRDREETEVASIAVLRDGELLWLRRADSGLWTMPGGHLNPDEEPLAGAIRELREETGLTPPPGDFEFLGEDLVPGNSKLRIFSFLVEVPSDTTPDLSKDPDQEASEFKWWDELPESEQCHVPHANNVTLKFLLDEDEIAKAERKEWRAKDGLKIPHHTTPERADWDKAYHAKLVEFFGNGDAKRLKPLKIPITPQTSGNNPVVSKARYSLYTRMLSGGDRLPPLVVRRNGLGWHVIDGNHRLEAGLKRGLKEMDAYELVDPPKVKKSEEPLDKMAIKDLKAPPKASHKTHRAGYGVGDRYDYSHLLPDAFKGRFKLAVDYHHDGHETAPIGYVTASLVHPRDWRKNNVESGFLGILETQHLDSKHYDPDEAGLHVSSAKIESPINIDGKWEILHGKGLGQALYEAAYAHAYHHLGERVVHGGYHSTMAGRVHEKLAEKHGLKYRAQKNPDKHNSPDGSFDNAHGEYSYVLKSDREDLVAAATESLDNSLRKPQYRSSPNPLTGHCYVASEALWHLMGGHESGWVPQNVKHEGDQHWYLRHSKTGEILDPTAGQFRTPVPYHQGRGRGFLTKEPSKRAAELISRIKSKLDKSEPLEKGFLTTAALAGSLALGQVNGADPDPKPSKALIEATQRAGIPAEPVKWSALGLHQSLIPIAHLESSFGQNVAHAPHPKGEYHTAHGALGFKPVTAHEEYLRAPALQKLYGDLKDPAVFMSKFKSDPKFYNLVATSHFMRLQKQHGSPERAAYAWRWGTGACQGASDEQVANEPYVMRYRDLAANAGLKKMAIKDLRPGKRTDPDSNEFDYSHMIKSPLLRRTYKLVVHHWPGDEYGDVAKASLVHRQTGNVAGFVEGTNEFVGSTRAINPSYAVIRDESIQGKGLGKALYSALFAHAHHVLGYKQVVGGEHSTSAHRVHEKLAQKHGWKYKPDFAPRRPTQERPFDGEYGPYHYKLT